VTKYVCSLVCPAILVVATVTSTAAGQTATLKGRVVNRLTCEPHGCDGVFGVSVMVFGSQTPALPCACYGKCDDREIEPIRTVVSNSTGSFELTGLRRGTHVYILYCMDDYLPHPSSGDYVLDNKIKSVTVELWKPKIDNDKEARMLAKAFVERAENPIPGIPIAERYAYEWSAIVALQSPVATLVRLARAITARADPEKLNVAAELQILAKINPAEVEKIRQYILVAATADNQENEAMTILRSSTKLPQQFLFNLYSEERAKQASVTPGWDQLETYLFSTASMNKVMASEIDPEKANKTGEAAAYSKEIAKEKAACKAKAAQEDKVAKEAKSR
jgi:hypothetical protein